MLTTAVGRMLTCAPAKRNWFGAAMFQVVAPCRFKVVPKIRLAPASVAGPLASTTPLVRMLLETLAARKPLTAKLSVP